MQKFRHSTVEIAYETLGPPEGKPVIWAHGWGQSHAAFLPLAASLEKSARHVLIDFPGFGQSPAPLEIWGTEAYADAMARFIKSLGNQPVLWIGHSFGCRVGLRLAAQYPELTSGLFLIAAAGLKRYRPWHGKYWYLKARMYLYKFLNKLIPLRLVDQQWLYSKFGSADYRNAGAMRGIFVKTVNEDLTATARAVQCPVQLAYGSMDTETPPAMGKRFEKLIGQAELIILNGLDHYTILGEGRHQVAAALKKFMEGLS